MFLKMKICRISINKKFKLAIFYTHVKCLLTTVLALYFKTRTKNWCYYFSTATCIVLVQKAFSFCADPLFVRQGRILFLAIAALLFFQLFLFSRICSGARELWSASFVCNTHKPRENTNILSFISCVYFACVNPIRSVTHPHHVGGNTSNKILHITPLLAQRFNRQDN